VRVLLLGDTSTWHAGSAATVQTLREMFPGVETAVSANPPQAQLGALKRDALEYDLVVANGEGSMHSGGGADTLAILHRAAQAGIPTALVNTLWQNQPWRLCSILPSLSYVAARDPWSQAEVLVLRDQCDLFADLCVNAWDGSSSERRGGTCYGSGGVGGLNPDFWPTRKSDYASWDDWVRCVSYEGVYITGEYHGMLAAGLAGTPVVCQRSNSWKMEALSSWSGCQIPVCDDVDELEREIEKGGAGGAAFRDFLLNIPRFNRRCLMGSEHACAT